MTPVQQFRAALYAGDVDRVRALLDQHAEVRDAINAPIGHFDSRPVMAAARSWRRRETCRSSTCCWRTARTST
jgi:hypothetical protein